jgi:hypothetical protein
MERKMPTVEISSLDAVQLRNAFVEYQERVKVGFFFFCYFQNDEHPAFFCFWFFSLGEQNLVTRLLKQKEEAQKERDELRAKIAELEVKQLHPFFSSWDPCFCFFFCSTNHWDPKREANCVKSLKNDLLFFSLFFFSLLVFRNGWRTSWWTM